MAGGGAQERLQLFGGPCLLFDLRDRPQARCVGDESDVAGDETSPGGVGERASDHEVDLVHGLGGERGRSVGGMEEPVVERLEVMGAEPPESDAAERRHDVVLDLAPVAVVGGGGEHEPLARQPASGEEGAEGQCPDLVVASLEVGRKACCEPLGVRPLAAGGVPASPLLARHRVDAFVDHRAPAVALPRDVALHGVPSFLARDGREAGRRIGRTTDRCLRSRVERARLTGVGVGVAR